MCKRNQALTKAQHGGHCLGEREVENQLSKEGWQKHRNLQTGERKKRTPRQGTSRSATKEAKLKLGSKQVKQRIEKVMPAQDYLTSSKLVGTQLGTEKHKWRDGYGTILGLEICCFRTVFHTHKN